MSDEAKRDNQAKADLSMLPAVFEAAVARVMSFGAEKYGRYNYLKGHRVTGLIASIKRHAAEILEGKDVDAESGQPHWAHIAANALMALHQQQLGTIKDDRYKPEPAAPPPPVTREYQIVSRNLRGTETVLEAWFSQEFAAMRLEQLAPEWPTFTLFIREVPFGYSETA